MIHNEHTALSDVARLSEVILDGATTYNLITVATLARRGIIEEVLHLLYEVTEVSYGDTDFDIGDAGVAYIDGGGSLVIDLQLELPGELGVAIEEVADDQGISFDETVVMLIEEGLTRMS